MAQQATITVFDYESPPVAHTLVPDGIEKKGNVEVAHYREFKTGVARDAQVALIVTREKLPSGVIKVSTDVRVPVSEVVTGANSAGYSAAPKVAYIDRQVSIAYIHPRSTVSSMRNCRQMATSMVVGNNTNNPGLVIDTATADLFDKGVFPS